MNSQVKELLLQALETELGGVDVYKTALECVVNDELRKEWEEYLDQTKQHVEVVREMLANLDISDRDETPGRAIVRHEGKSKVKAMKMALDAGDKRAAQLVAAEAVVGAETKDHANWSLIGELARQLTGDDARVLREAHEQVEDEEDEHLYHTKGWASELWIESLGMPAVLPPPEEEKDVRTAIGAARAKKSRKNML